MSLSGSYSNLRPSTDRAAHARNATTNGETTVRCKHCSKVLALDALEEHEAFFCPLKPIRCQHFKANGELCGFVCSGADALRDHYKTCKDHPRKRRAVSIRDGASPRGSSTRNVDLCEDCQQVFPDRATLVEHQTICPLKNVPCPLLCGQWMQRDQVPDHILHTAMRHKPLRRPSTSDYGGDNIHMVVAVLMEALQNSKKLLQKQQQQQQQQQRLHKSAVLDEETMSNITPGMSFNHPSSRHSTVSVEEPVRSPKSLNSASVRVERMEESAKVNAADAASMSDDPFEQASGAQNGDGDEEGEVDAVTVVVSQESERPSRVAVTEPSPEAAAPEAEAGDDEEGEENKAAEPLMEKEEVEPPLSPPTPLFDDPAETQPIQQEVAEEEINRESSKEGAVEQDTTPMVNTLPGNNKSGEVPPQRAVRLHRRKTSLPKKGRRGSTAGIAAALPPPPSAARPAFRSSAAAAASQPSKIRYEDFLVVPAERMHRRQTPPRSVRLRPTHSRPALSPRARVVASDGVPSPRLQAPPQPVTASPRVNSLNASQKGE